MRYPEAVPEAERASPASPWRCSRCRRRVYPIGPHTCDDPDATLCLGVFSRSTTPPVCGCDVDDLDHSQVYDQRHPRRP